MFIVKNALDTTRANAKWQYFLDKPMDGKPIGWHNYDSQPSARLEKEHNNRPTEPESRRCVWHLRSGYFQYEVNLGNMTQRNMSTGRVRTIRRHEEETMSTIPGKPEAADTIEAEDLEDSLPIAQLVQARRTKSQGSTEEPQDQTRVKKENKVSPIKRTRLVKRKLRSSPLRSFPKRRMILVRNLVF